MEMLKATSKSCDPAVHLFLPSFAAAARDEGFFPFLPFLRKSQSKATEVTSVHDAGLPFFFFPLEYEIGGDQLRRALDRGCFPSLSPKEQQPDLPFRPNRALSFSSPSRQGPAPSLFSALPSYRNAVKDSILSASLLSFPGNVMRPQIFYACR